MGHKWEFKHWNNLAFGGLGLGFLACPGTSAVLCQEKDAQKEQEQSIGQE